MQGYVPVEILTKKYVKAYITSSLGEKPVMEKSSLIGQKLYDLLSHQTNERLDQFSSKHYTEKLRIYIPIRTFRVRGSFLNHTNIKNLNLFIEALIKERFYNIMDDLTSVLPSFEANLPEARRRLGIDIEDWADDSMQKDYYRYRLRTGKPSLR